MSAQTQNQFNQSPIQGQAGLGRQPSTISAQIDVSSAGGLIAGQAVKLVPTAAPGVPHVVECADDSDDVYGFINYNIRNATFKAYDSVELSAFRGNYMWMTAAGAITQGADVMIVIASKKVTTATSGNRIIGKAFDQAAADGDMIRVYINLPGALA